MGMDDFLTTGWVWFPGRLVRLDHSHARACHVISEQLAGISLTADPFASRKGVRSGHRRRYMIGYRGEAARKEMPSVRLR